MTDYSLWSTRQAAVLGTGGLSSAAQRWLMRNPGSDQAARNSSSCRQAAQALLPFGRAVEMRSWKRV